MKNQTILLQLRAGKRRKVFLELYKAYPAVEKFIRSKGGSSNDAEDTFQEALIIFYRKASMDSFQLTAKASTYVYSICRYLWADQLKKKNKLQQLDFNGQFELEEESDFEELIEKESKLKLIDNILLEIGERCLQILQLFYYKKKSMRIIADEMNFKSEKIARNQKYKCLERAKLKLEGVIERGGEK